MKIALYGATGNIGHSLLAEALRRGHQVTAIVRGDTSRLPAAPGLTVVSGDVTRLDSVASQVAGHDAVIGSLSGRRDGDAHLAVDAARTLLAGAQNAGVPRVLWVGGAGSLTVPGGARLMDSPAFPEDYRPEAEAGAAILDLFRADTGATNWTYLSPPAEIGPGERRGSFRLGGDELVTDAEGRSRISYDDYAIALLDEVEKPRHPRARFTVAY